MVEEGSLHRAATRLHISQPALSHQMQALEHELGGRLLERLATGVSPTAGGQALAKTMGAVLASYDLAVSVRGALYAGRPMNYELLTCPQPRSSTLPDR